MTQPRLVLLLPAYNAAPTLAAVLAEVSSYGFPILVVNDGSRDETGEVASAGPVWKIASHPRNRGKGAALKTGFAEAVEGGFTHALTIDSDGQHPASAIPQFAAGSAAKPGAILVGNRFADKQIEDMPLVRRISNGLSSMLVSLAAGTRIPDAQCGMRVYPLQILKDLPLDSDGYALETEVLVKASRMNIEVVNIPISCQYPDGTATSRYRPIVDSWRIARVILRSIRKRP
jgi:glycosyltransferase involved in cell wall biosynthesis